MKSLTIMRPGCFVAMNGGRTCFTAADLAQVAATYNPIVHEAPLVLGHPADDASAPAHGWVTRLRLAPDGALVASLEDVSEALKTMVKDGRYRHLSASFWPPGHPASPSPGGYSLRHVGALGASTPAVSGLSMLAFADGCAIDCCAPCNLALPRPGVDGFMGPLDAAIVGRARAIHAAAGACGAPISYTTAVDRAEREIL